MSQAIAHFAAKLRSAKHLTESECEQLAKIIETQDGFLRDRTDALQRMGSMLGLLAGTDLVTDLPRLLEQRLRGPLDEAKRQQVLDAVSSSLGEAWDCLRVWEAWGVGTMGPEDFVQVADQDDRVAEIAGAVLDVLYPPPVVDPEPPQ